MHGGVVLHKSVMDASTTLTTLPYSAGLCLHEAQSANGPQQHVH